MTAWLSALVLVFTIAWAGVAPALAADLETAVFAGGCFWCLEHDLEHLPGVVEAISGYSGGHVDQPTYQQVSGERTGHQESVQVRFDPERLPYSRLLRSYWRNVDPLNGGGQFCDRGDSYRPVVFTADAAQAEAAASSAAEAARELGRPRSDIKVEIRESARFWPAEGYHQNYAERNELKYNFYRFSCGRDRRLDQVWGDNSRSDAAWSTP